MVRRSLILCLSLLCGGAWAQSCTSTLSAGANVGSAISSASGGDVICLNNGNYSGFTLNNVSKSPRVTIRAVNSGSANFTGGITFSGSTSGLTFDGINYTGIYATGVSISNLTFKNGDASKGVVEIDYVTTTTPNLVFENLTHYDQDAIGQCGTAANCVKVAAYLIGGGNYRSNTNPVAIIRGARIVGGCADGIQIGSPTWVEYSYIANRRAFATSCTGDPHTDGIQFFGWPLDGTTVRYNYLYNNSQMLGAYDAVWNSTIEHNVFDSGTEGRPHSIELYADDSSIVRNNTLIDRGLNGIGQSTGGILLSRKLDGSQPDFGVDTQIYNNIIIYSVATENGSTWGLNTHNLYSGASSPNINGVATFAGTCGGALSAGQNWTGCRLAPGSAGKNAGTDGKDVGTHYYGVRKPGGLN